MVLWVADRPYVQHAERKLVPADLDDQRQLAGGLQDVGDALVVTSAQSRTASPRM